MGNNAEHRGTDCPTSHSDAGANEGVEEKFEKRTKTRADKRRKRLVSKVPEPEVAEYVFTLIRTLVLITRRYRDAGLTTYFLEMAAMEIAPLMRREASETPPHESTRATS